MNEFKDSITKLKSNKLPWIAPKLDYLEISQDTNGKATHTPVETTVANTAGPS